MTYNDVINEREKTKIKFIKTQLEKGEYLGEFKENILAALTKDQLEEDNVYEEILKEMKKPGASIVKMRRDIPLKCLKPYIREAEKIKLRYQLIDGLSYRGDIALVVVSKETQDNAGKNLVIRDMDQDFLDAGLEERLSKARGKKVCKECYKKVEEKLPQYLDEFKRVGVIDRLLGYKCPGHIEK